MKNLFVKTLGIATAVGTVASTALLTVTSSGITVETADVQNISSANSVYLTSSFEITKFIPTIAILSAGQYVLNKVFSFVPKPAGA